MEKRKWWQKVLRPAAALGRLFIPNLGTLLIVGLLFWAQQAGALGGRPQGIAPNVLPGIITYQGKLTDAAGDPITGNVNMTFALYDVPTGGTALWSETYDGANAVPVQGGEFVVHLGSINPIPAAVMEQSPLYLGMTVAGDEEMASREELTVVPYAMMAGTVPDGAVTTAKLAAGAVTSAKIADGTIATADLADGAVTWAKAPGFVRMEGCAHPKIVVWAGEVPTEGRLLEWPGAFAMNVVVGSWWGWAGEEHRPYVAVGNPPGQSSMTNGALVKIVDRASGAYMSSWASVIAVGCAP